jgi:hypothetical protein
MNGMASQQSLKLVCTAALLGALAVLPASAQAPAPSGPPKPSPELGKLAFFAGDWTCKGKAEASPMGPAHATTGKVHIAKEIAGFWYVGRYSEAKSAANSHPMVFHFIEGYDAAAKTFTMDCFDAFGGRCHQTSAGWEGDKLVYTGESTGSSPTPTPVRDTFTKTGGASLEHMGEMQVAGKWVATDHETCKRAKK